MKICILEPRVDSLVDRVRTYRGRRMSPQGLAACAPLVFCRVLALSLEPRLYGCRVVWHLLRYSLVIVYLLATRTLLFCCSSHNQSLHTTNTSTPTLLSQWPLNVSPTFFPTSLPAARARSSRCMRLPIPTSYSHGKHLADRASPTAPPRTPTMLSSLSPSGHL
jgi:hypothetical protein